MKTTDDGGPAFPVPLAAVTADNGDFVCWDATDRGLGGMTLLDWFAGQALGGLIAGPNVYAGPIRSAEDVADLAYAYADAMLAARKQVRG